MPVYGYGQVGGGDGHLEGKWQRSFGRKQRHTPCCLDRCRSMHGFEVGIGDLRAAEGTAYGRMREGLVVVHYYDLRHVQHAVAEIQAQHVAHQARIAMWHRATAAGQGFGHGGQGQWVMVWAWGDILEGSVGVVGRGERGENRGPLVVFNLAEEVTMGKLKEIFKAFGKREG
ncbi:hypothetical protein AMTR_s00010p00253960 [Amborella trichopoda]|uniref:RRM domain-containing protein n=1 Tax=Amborella trichopoda TaxID=13333 RepID=W1NFY7_AMBTC|nr:hypothetical protein AMTR_s00010p00253960 [Amborella trichopoda]